MAPPLPATTPGEGPAAAAAGEPAAAEGAQAAGAPPAASAAAPVAVTQAVAEQGEPSPAALKALKRIQGEGVPRALGRPKVSWACIMLPAPSQGSIDFCRMCALWRRLK
jgi:hypothetical protein